MTYINYAHLICTVSWYLLFPAKCVKIKLSTTNHVCLHFHSILGKLIIWIRNSDLLLVHRLRRWPNIKSALGQRIAFIGHKLCHTLFDLDISTWFMASSSVPSPSTASRSVCTSLSVGVISRYTVVRRSKPFSLRNRSCSKSWKPESLKNGYFIIMAVEFV